MISIGEGNLLIVKFMGYEDYNDTCTFIKDVSHKFVLTYDKCWSELMPVIEKIEAIRRRPDSAYGDYYVTIEQLTCRIHMLDCPPISSSMGETKIQAVWEAVVGFIKWYNEYIPIRFTESPAAE